MKNFITVEGCDGVGKTAQIQMLKKYCAQKGFNVLFTREPGGSPLAEKIREIILDANNKEMCDLCEALLYAAARAQHLNDTVIPALKEGKTVICDRFVDSSYAYQGVGRGIGLEKIETLNAVAVGQYMPQWTLFLDLTPDKAFERKGGADKNNRLEAQAFEMHKKVYEGYLEVIRRNPERFIVIDASGEKLETHQKVVKSLLLRGILK